MPPELAPPGTHRCGRIGDNVQPVSIQRGGTMARRVPGLSIFVASPIMRRIAWHARRIVGGVDKRFFLSLLEGAAVLVFAAALLVTLVDKPLPADLGSAVGVFGKSVNWAI